MIGSGGKTSYIKELKEQYLQENKTVLITTTTHMMIEKETLVDASYDQIMDEISKNGFCHAGNKGDERKICALNNDVFSRLKKCRCDFDRGRWIETATFKVSKRG